MNSPPRFTEDAIEHENGLGSIGWQAIVWDEDQGSMQAHCYGYGGDKGWHSEDSAFRHPVIYRSAKKALNKGARFARRRNKNTWVQVK